MPRLQSLALDPDGGAERVAAGHLAEADQLREFGRTLQRERANVGAVAKPQQYLAVGTQFNRHDIEQVGVDAEDGEEGIRRVDIPEHAERDPAELIDPKKQQA